MCLGGIHECTVPPPWLQNRNLRVGVVRLLQVLTYSIPPPPLLGGKHSVTSAANQLCLPPSPVALLGTFPNAGALLSARGRSVDGHDLSSATNTLGGWVLGRRLTSPFPSSPQLGVPPLVATSTRHVSFPAPPLPLLGTPPPPNLTTRWPSPWSAPSWWLTCTSSLTPPLRTSWSASLAWSAAARKVGLRALLGATVLGSLLVTPCGVGYFVACC